jgi:hypothetical protein
MPDPSSPSAGPVTFEELGERLHDALLAAYHSRVGASTLFGFIPGGTPVPDNLATKDGIVNPLLVTTWLATVAEAPLAIDVASAAVTASYSSLQRAASMFDEVVRYAQPVDAGTAAGQRFASMRARAAANDLGQLPLGCQPQDWPLPTAPYWTAFNSQDSTSDASSTTKAGPATPAPPIGQKIWQLRMLPSFEVAPPSESPTPPQQASPRLVPARAMFSPIAMTSLEAAPKREETETATVAIRPAVRGAYFADAKATAATAPTAPSPPLVSYRVLPFQRGLFAVAQNTATSSSTATEVVTMSLSHTVVMIDRSAWWDDNLMRDPGWCIPGLPSGAWVAAPGVDSDVIVGLPVALLLVKSLDISGTFTEQDVTDLHAGNAALGPFSLQQATSILSGGTTTISMDGMQLIGVFCAPLPVLPPQDGTKPETSTSTPDPTPTTTTSTPDPTPTTSTSTPDPTPTTTTGDATSKEGNGGSSPDSDGGSQ